MLSIISKLLIFGIQLHATIQEIYVLWRFYRYAFIMSVCYETMSYFQLNWL